MLDATETKRKVSTGLRRIRALCIAGLILASCGLAPGAFAADPARCSHHAEAVCEARLLVERERRQYATKSDLEQLRAEFRAENEKREKAKADWNRRAGDFFVALIVGLLGASLALSAMAGWPWSSSSAAPRSGPHDSIDATCRKLDALPLKIALRVVPILIFGSIIIVGLWVKLMQVLVCAHGRPWPVWLGGCSAL